MKEWESGIKFSRRRRGGEGSPQPLKSRREVVAESDVTEGKLKRLWLICCLRI